MSSAFVFEELIGKTPVSISVETGSEKATITLDNGMVAEMYHQQDCCEHVRIEDVVGEPKNLIGHPLSMAEVVSEEGESDWGTATWSFFKFGSMGGYVTIRWLGESNGYYSESVDLEITINGKTYKKYLAYDRN